MSILYYIYIMRQEDYPIYGVAQGDVIFGMRNGVSANFGGFTGANTGNIIAEVILTKAQVLALSVTPIVIATAPTGFAIQPIIAPSMYVDPDGAPFISGSGWTIDILNNSANFPTLATFVDGNISSIAAGTFCSNYFGGYELVTGDVFLKGQPSPITGGGSNAFMRFFFEYRLIAL